MKKFIFIILVFFVLTNSFAQHVNNIGLFPVYSQSGVLYKKLNYNIFLFGAIDLNKTSNNWFMFYDENSISYMFSDRLSASVSYTYQRSNVLDKYATNENRVWQQIQYEHPLNDRLSLKHRLRFDERFIEDKSTNTYPFSHRLRYLIGGKYTLNEKFYLSAYNEFFFNTSTPSSIVYGENWGFIGLGIKTSTNTSLDLGPTYITWVTNDELDRLNLWYLQVQFNTTINLKTK